MNYHKYSPSYGYTSLLRAPLLLFPLRRPPLFSFCHDALDVLELQPLRLEHEPIHEHEPRAAHRRVQRVPSSPPAATSGKKLAPTTVFAA